MKFRGLLLIVFLLSLMASSAHGEGAQIKFFWTNVDHGGNPAWYPLLYNCNNLESDTLRDGSVVRLFKSTDFDPPNPETDIPLEIGHNGGGGEVWPANYFLFNSEIVLGYGGTCGSFISDFISFEGDMPVPSIIMYLQIGCWTEDSTIWNCSYYSHRMVPAAGYQEYLIGNEQVNPFGDPVWTCVDSCPEPPDAIGDPFSEIPRTFEIAAYPNPFNPSTTISFTTTKTTHVRLTVCDLTGREVDSLIDAVLGNGAHEVVFNAAGLPSGIYLARLQMAEATMTKKLVLLK